MQITKEDNFIVFKPENAHFSTDLSSKMEKTVASAYGSEGMVNFIADFSLVKTVSAESINLFQKIQRITHKEGGLFILVNDHDDLLDDLANQGLNEIAMLANVEEATEAMYIHLSNEDDEDREDDEFSDESDY
jgi:hypothetical protein